MEGAQVVIHGATDTFTVTTDEVGYYFQWIDATDNPSLDIDVTATDHSSGQALDVAIIPGSTVTQDFDLHWLVPCESVTPESVSESLQLGETSSQQIVLENNGYADLEWEISEMPSIRKLGTDQLLLLLQCIPIQPPSHTQQARTLCLVTQSHAITHPVMLTTTT